MLTFTLEWCPSIRWVVRQARAAEQNAGLEQELLYVQGESTSQKSTRAALDAVESENASLRRQNEALQTECRTVADKLQVAKANLIATVRTRDDFHTALEQERKTCVLSPFYRLRLLLSETKLFFGQNESTQRRCFHQSRHDGLRLDANRGRTEARCVSSTRRTLSSRRVVRHVLPRTAQPHNRTVVHSAMPASCVGAIASFQNAHVLSVPLRTDVRYGEKDRCSLRGVGPMFAAVGRTDVRCGRQKQC
jgi:hypothetical protein